MAFLMDLLGDVVDLYGSVDEAAEAGYETALDMCGNAGQYSIIEQMGIGPFQDAAESMITGAGSYEGFQILMSEASHPDAVVVILSRAARIIALMMLEAFMEAWAEMLEELEENPWMEDYI